MSTFVPIQLGAALPWLVPSTLALHLAPYQRPSASTAIYLRSLYSYHHPIALSVYTLHTLPNVHL